MSVSERILADALDIRLLDASVLTLRVLGSLDLRDDDGREVPAALAQPKRAALLAYLCVRAPSGYCRRDTLLALFWPEADTEHARAALRQRPARRMSWWCCHSPSRARTPSPISATAWGGCSRRISTA